MALCFLCKDAKPVQTVDDADIVAIFKIANDNFESGSLCCDECIDDAKNFVSKYKYNSSKSTARSSLTNACLGSQTSTSQSQPQSQPQQSQPQPVVSDSQLSSSSSSEPQPDAARLPQVKPMPRSKKAQYLARSAERSDNLSNSGDLSDVSLVSSMLGEIEVQTAEDGAEHQTSKRSSPDVVAALPKRQRIEPNPGPPVEVAAFEEVPRPISQASSTDEYDRMINSQPMYIPTPLADRSTDQLRPTARTANRSQRPLSFTGPRPSTIREASSTPTAPQPPVAATLPNAPQPAATMRSPPPVTTSKTVQPRPPPPPVPSPVAGPSGMQQRPISRFVTAISYDSSDTSGDIDPDDIVPVQLRQKPSQVPRRRNITPPRSAPTTPVVAIPLNDYQRVGGG